MEFIKSITVIFVFGAFSIFAQDEGIEVKVDNTYVPVGEITPKHTFNMVVGLPNASVNKPFESIMRGIVDVNPYYQYSLPNSIVFGAGFRFTHFSINEFRVPEPLDGVMNSFGGFIKAGYEKFYTTRFAMDFSVKAGYNWHILSTDLNKEKRGGAYRFDSGFVEPIIGFILSATEHSSFRLTASYTFQGYIFTPHQLGTEMSGGWEAKEFNKSAQFFTFGLGYTYYFGKFNN
jgi:hypothetical protein